VLEAVIGMAGVDRGCVKTSARFDTNLFRSLFRGLRAFRIEKIAENFALLDRSQFFVEFPHSLDPKRKLEDLAAKVGIGARIRT
jgi:hypothetical protein